MNTKKKNSDAIAQQPAHPGGNAPSSNEGAAKLVLLPPPEMSNEEQRVIDAFIRRKRAAARWDAAAGELKSTVLAILQHRKQVERHGAVVKLDRKYEYAYSQTVADLQAACKEVCKQERESKKAAATVKVGVAFEDVRAKQDAAERKQADG